MPHRKNTLGGWGHKITVCQLSDALQSNRTEFLELCRRVTCDEIAAHSLFGVVENILNNEESSDGSSTQKLLNSLKLHGKHSPGDAYMLREANEAANKIEEEVNLIQLLAEVHLMTVTQGVRR